jgi:hypothetical protein
MHPGIRLVAAAALLGLVLVSGVHYDAAEPDHWPYPTPEELETEPDQHADQRVFLFGTVERLDETAGTARIRVESDEGPFVVDVTGFGTERDVRPGGTVQVVGEFRPGYVVAAERVRVVNPAGSSRLYKYAVSGVAALLVLILFFRHWRADVGTLSFEAR